jgi:hypothetical protein
MSKKLFLETHQREGEIYAGVILGERDYHLFLMPFKPLYLLMGWRAAMHWAKSVGGSLPNRQEQAILYGNLKHEFEARWHWSSEQYAYNTDYAWMQSFGNGSQGYGRKSNGHRARAVRRVYIDELE